LNWGVEVEDGTVLLCDTVNGCWDGVEPADRVVDTLSGFGPLEEAIVVGEGGGRQVDDGIERMIDGME
jgi:hypothetical protein